jgi:hypothetical protein
MGISNLRHTLFAQKRKEKKDIQTPIDAILLTFFHA